MGATVKEEEILPIKKGLLLPQKKMASQSSLVAQWVKDLALSLEQPGSLCGVGSIPGPGNFHMPQMWPKKNLINKGLPSNAEGRMGQDKTCFPSIPLRKW